MSIAFFTTSPPGGSTASDRPAVAFHSPLRDNCNLTSFPCDLPCSLLSANATTPRSSSASALVQRRVVHGRAEREYEVVKQRILPSSATSSRQRRRLKRHACGVQAVVLSHGELESLVEEILG